jgi:hypothetical protein
VFSAPAQQRRSPFTSQIPHSSGGIAIVLGVAALLTAVFAPLTTRL